ncbi:hypothetical protein FK531_17005 [Rhodococcus spelaei]|uniref:Uncharacterized protein n=1 Tax=Rhodococcus spelaei TaxID=2546320 RepID=A0A541B1N1_9NOCA|nr:tellurite resistance/C4-dicarboxylate transporter family protein [Rhodococcus spelaei]TQF66232.1 hypothetical protein FK531_17005 [Rhodococcus spelaei]
MDPDRVIAAVPAGAGAAAMATGVVSVGLHLAGIEWFSILWLGIGTGIWLALLGVFAFRLTDDRTRWIADADTPAALTAVAATTVLGTRFALLGWQPVAIAALAAAFVLWVVLNPFVISHWTTPTVGTHFLLCVATQGLAVLGATLAADLHARWLTGAALVVFVGGLGCYAAVVARFSFAQFRAGAGDQWVCAGALAISALAAGKLIVATDASGWDGWPHTAVRVLAVALVAADLSLYAVLAACEVRWPRLWFDFRRWATAFPLGMSAVATTTVATALDLPWLRAVGLALIWPAAVLCTILLVASVRYLTDASAATAR